MTLKIASLFLIVFLFAACKNETSQKEISPVEKEMALQITNPSEGKSQLPRLFSNGMELYLSWVTQKDSIDRLNYAVLKDGNWSQPTEIVQGNDWFTNWADFPALAENNGNILTSYLQKSASGTYTYDVKLNLYNAKTKNWKKNFILHNDGTQSEHGFVSIRPYAGDSFLVVWLDGRETVGKEHGGGQMTLRGAIVFEDGTIDYDTLLDEKVCDCCQTAAAIGADDQIIVAYRDRSDEEIRDISIVDWTKEANWSKPRTVGNDQWKIAGCPVNGPSMDAMNTSVAIAWFTAAREEGEVQVAFSTDGAKTFGNSIRIDAGNATGRVDVVLLSETEAAVLWMEPEGDDEVIQLMKVSADGQKGKPITISKTSAERASGFPQLERVGDSLFVAWTVVEEKEPHIDMVSLGVMDL